MLRKVRFDTHCHLFTLEFAIKEVKHIMRDMLLGSYPLRKSIVLPQSDRWFEIKQLLKWLYEVIHVAGANEQENFNFLQMEARQQFPDDTFRAVPLMMDFFYVLAHDFDKGNALDVCFKSKRHQLNVREFQNYWNWVIDDFKAYILNSEDYNDLIQTDYETIRRDTALIILERERDVSNVIDIPTEAKSYKGAEYYYTEGFDFHLNNLLGIMKKRKGELYPFIAVDPRRPGIVNDILSGKFFSGEQRFYGINLYPAMGFHPECKQLEKVYQFCNYNSLPITTHCAQSIFPPIVDWRLTGYGNPIHFESILKRYPKLRINFAHMGLSDPYNIWVKIINSLIRLYDNVYTDISCFTSTDLLLPVKQQWDANPNIREKILFGSDYGLNYLVMNGLALKQYCKNFQDVFQPNELGRMMDDNPARFLGVDTSKDHFSRNISHVFQNKM